MNMLCSEIPSIVVLLTNSLKHIRQMLIRKFLLLKALTPSFTK